MTLGAVAFAVALFWILLHAFARRSASTSSGSLLPRPLTSSRPRLRSHGRPTTLFHTPTTRLTLSALALTLESTALNVPHDALAARLTRRRHAPLRRALLVFYDAGTALGALGMAASLALLVWTLWQLSQVLFYASPVPSDLAAPALASATAAHAKRTFEDAIIPANSVIANDDIQLKLLIPGVTVPLSHLLPLLTALFLAQAIHEGGHALSAALDSVPLSALGASLNLFLPAFFVALPSSSLQTLPARPRARIAAAGALHNLALYVLLIALARLGVGSAALWAVGYENVGDTGRVVVSVDEDSPLAPHIPLGALITALDDIPLGLSTDTSASHLSAYTTSQYADPWDTYLTASDHSPGFDPGTDAGSGWCIPESWFLSQASACCAPPASLSFPSLVCFVPVSAPTPALLSPASASTDPPGSHCLDPVPLLRPTTPRCAPRQSSYQSPQPSASQTCPDPSDICVRPRADALLLRITLLDTEHSPRADSDPDSDASASASTTVKTIGHEHSRAHERVVLWRGPKLEVWEQVQVSTLRPRWTWAWTLLPFLLTLPSATTTFFSYLETLTLSLFLFNLLPLPRLDGSPLLDALFELELGLSPRPYASSPSSSRTRNASELEEMESGLGFQPTERSEMGQNLGHKHAPWKERARRIVRGVTASLVGSCALLGIGVAMKTAWT